MWNHLAIELNTLWFDLRIILFDLFNLIEILFLKNEFNFTSLLRSPG